MDAVLAEVARVGGWGLVGAEAARDKLAGVVEESHPAAVLGDYEFQTKLEAQVTRATGPVNSALHGDIAVRKGRYDDSGQAHKNESWTNTYSHNQTL